MAISCSKDTADPPLINPELWEMLQDKPSAAETRELPGRCVDGHQGRRSPSCPSAGQGSKVKNMNILM